MWQPPRKENEIGLLHLVVEERKSEGLCPFFLYGFIQRHLAEAKRSPLVENVGLSSKYDLLYN